MKYAIILPDGAADEPVEQLGGRTPLEAARKPSMDWIAEHGRQGIVTTVPAEFSPGSDVATLSLFGYDPRTCHDGRAPLEAAAQGLKLAENEIVFRCNFVTIANGTMADFTAGHIRQTEADRLIDDLNSRLESFGCRFHSGVSYRNLMVATYAGSMKPRCTPPHDIPDKNIAEHHPTGPGSEWVRDIMTHASEVLRDHEVNLVRRDLGENPATDIWLWGQGRQVKIESFAARFKVSGAVIAAVDLIRGIAVGVGMKIIDVPGATGYLDTDYAAKGRAAVAAVDQYDLVIVHVEAPDEAGHQGDVDAKVLALERVDEHVVSPILEKLRSFAEWKILIAPDHPTPVMKRVHTNTPPPFCMAGTGVESIHQNPFSESFARETGLHVDPGHELMEYFLKR
ncbi:MAG: cofactor-independent phosphoglycerate mutase [Planctomycetota bacterium]